MSEGRDMSNREAIEMMGRVHDELKQQRGVIDALAPKAEAYDTIRKILSLLPGQGGYAAPDITWELSKRINELRTIEKEKEAERPAA